MYNYSLYHIVNRNILFNAIVTCMNKYNIIIYVGEALDYMDHFILPIYKRKIQLSTYYLCKCIKRRYKIEITACF